MDVWGPATWCKKYPECGGKNQSPINIETKYVECDEDLTDFSYRGYDTIPTMEMPVFHLKAWQAGEYCIDCRMIMQRCYADDVVDDDGDDFDDDNDDFDFDCDYMYDYMHDYDCDGDWDW